ncbi:MAG: GGDEF domain-containing protein [Oscillospiraceae bacterium]
MKLLKNIQLALAARAAYFSDAKDEISKSNIDVLFLSSSLAFLFLLLLILLTPLIIKDWTVSVEYFLLMPALAAFAVISYIYKKRKQCSYAVVQSLCLLFYTVLIAFFIVLNVYTEPFRPDSFLALCYMFMPVLFIIKPAYIFTLSILSELIYILLAFRFKSPEVVDHDIFVTLAALLFSSAVSWITFSLRTQNYMSRVKFQKLSMTDMLTGILNKASFEENCRTYLEASHGDCCALCVIDVDNFKNINDTFGHQSGDAVLSKIGSLLRAGFRADDIVGRVGGDEFCVLMKNVPSPDAVQKKLDRVRRALMQLHSDDNCCLTCSIGSVFLQAQITEYEQAFKTADRALYEAKGTGGNSVILFMA